MSAVLISFKIFSIQRNITGYMMGATRLSAVMAIIVESGKF